VRTQWRGRKEDRNRAEKERERRYGEGRRGASISERIQEVWISIAKQRVNKHDTESPLESLVSFVSSIYRSSRKYALLLGDYLCEKKRNDGRASRRGRASATEGSNSCSSTVECRLESCVAMRYGTLILTSEIAMYYIVFPVEFYS